MADENAVPPQPDFDFIMKQEPKPKRSLALPGNLPKPAVLGGGAVLALFLILIVSSLLNRAPSYTTVYGLLTDAGRISSTCDDATTSISTADTLALTATVKNTLNSQSQQLQNYLTARKVKVNQKLYSTTLDSATANTLSNAKLNGTYEATFLAYLRRSLNAYQSDLQANYKTAGPSLKQLLASAYASNQVVLKDKHLQ